ncbi:Imm70 family immunity protein [Actinomyces weissii]|uniref:Uncharacterized protein n=1 Tax=Actinomyces weissii TaxID=675090 RepID=A0A7T7MBJ1_9ACTO|nr:Imm70 family immunity protein [Actinomyces weissii]QQM68480.1 hypothetical protein JG540_09935 [Actinomyces weissii]
MGEVDQGLAGLAASKVVWGIEGLSVPPPWGSSISPEITGLSSCFVASGGEDFILRLRHALEQALAAGSDLTVESM